MIRTIQGLLLVAVLAGTASPVWASPAAAEAQKAQRKLLAARAARTDALRKLAERIKGLQIDSATTVRDFVAASDDIEAGLLAFLSNMQEVGRPRYVEDGTCEVTVEVTIEEVVRTLKRFHREFYKGGKLHIEVIDKIVEQTKERVFREVGTGTAPEAFLEPPTIVVRPGQAVQLGQLTPKAKAYWLAHCTGRGRLTAERAARVVAMRRLAERIKGVYITSKTTVKDFVAESDEINVDLRAFVRGVREVGVRYHEDELIVEIDMQVKLRNLYMDLKTWGEAHYKGDKLKLRKLEEMTLKAADTIVRETGFGVPPERYLKDLTANDKQVLEMSSGENLPPWVTRKLRAIGQAALDPDDENAARAKLIAFRAAGIDGRRRLAEQLHGLQIASKTTVEDFVARNDEINTAMLTFQQGARVLDDTQELAEDGTAKVAVEIDLKPLWVMIVHYKRTLAIELE